MTELQQKMIDAEPWFTSEQISIVSGRKAISVQDEVFKLRKRGIVITTKRIKKTAYYFFETDRATVIKILTQRQDYKRRPQNIQKVKSLGKPAFGFESWAIITKERHEGYIGYGQRVRGEQCADESAEQAYQLRRKLGLDRLTGL